jgi:hypothetical protein
MTHALCDKLPHPLLKFLHCIQKNNRSDRKNVILTKFDKTFYLKFSMIRMWNLFGGTELNVLYWKKVRFGSTLCV